MSIPNSVLKNKDYIFVDFFDTIMFRYIHSDEIRPQWAKVMNKFYPTVDVETWIKARNEYIGNYDECGIKYEDLIKGLYEILSTEISVDYEAFKNKVFEADKYVDMAVQYPNKHMVSWLKIQKKLGKKIYIVSDYYLPAEVYYDFLDFYDLKELFNGVYSSSDHEKTKQSGELYEYVVGELKIDKKKVIMIGDSKTSDYLKAIEAGIDSYRYFPVKHKIYTNIHKRCVRVNIDKYVFNKCYKYTEFAEYGMDLFVFCKQLSKVLIHDSNQSRILNFMSRGGVLAQKIF